MKRALFLLSAILFLAGCTKTNEFDPKPNYGSEEANPLTSIYAGFADDDSRTYVENDTDILWQNGDALSLFYAHFLNMKFEYKGEDGARMAKFDFVYGTGDPADSDAPYLKTHALYPYDERAISEYDAASQSFTISTRFPATQHYAPNSFGRGANLMVAAAHSSSNGMKDEQILFRIEKAVVTVQTPYHRRSVLGAEVYPALVGGNHRHARRQTVYMGKLQVFKIGVLPREQIFVHIYTSRVGRCHKYTTPPKCKIDLAAGLSTTNRLR